MGDKPTLSRRGLIGAAAGTAAASALTPWSASAHGRHRHHHERSRLLPKSRIGIQLYTVGDQVNTLGFAEVFKRLAGIGYKEVEFAGYNAQGRRWSNQELAGCCASTASQPRAATSATGRSARISSRCSTTPRRSA